MKLGGALQAKEEKVIIGALCIEDNRAGHRRPVCIWPEPHVSLPNYVVYPRIYVQGVQLPKAEQVLNWSSNNGWGPQKLNSSGPIRITRYRFDTASSRADRSIPRSWIFPLDRDLWDITFTSSKRGQSRSALLKK